jgi:peptidoglycan/LPS O-acetylase OafA/YrhL
LLWIGVVGIVFISFLNSLGIHPKYNYYLKSNIFRFFSNAFLWSFIPLFFSIMLPFASNILTFKIGAVNRVITHVSKISYSMYLIHYSLVYIPFFKHATNNSGFRAILLFIAYWSIVIILSSVLYKCIEHPFLQLRERIHR